MTRRPVAPRTEGGWVAVAAVLAVALVLTGLLPALAPPTASTADARLEAPSHGDRPLHVDQTFPLVIVLGGTLLGAIFDLPLPLLAGRMADVAQGVGPPRADRVPSPPPRSIA